MKKNILIIISILLGIILVIFMCFLFTKPKENSKTNYQETETNTIKKGGVKKIATSESLILRVKNGIEDSLWEINDKDYNIILIDKTGYQHNLGKPDVYLYLGDGYVALYKDGNSKLVVYDSKEKKEIQIFDNKENVTWNGSILYNYFDYKDGVLYYSIYNDEKTVAYDVKKQRELWTSKGLLLPDKLGIRAGSITGSNRSKGLGLEEKFIRLSTKDSAVNPDKKIIVDYNGNIIFDGTGQEDKVYTTKTNYYIRYKEKEYIKVYNFENQLISEIIFPEDGKIYSLAKVFNNGMFSVSIDVKKEGEISIDYSKRRSILYDLWGNIVLESKEIGEDIRNNSILKNSHFVEFEEDVFFIKTAYGDKNRIIKDNKIVGQYDYFYTKYNYVDDNGHYLILNDYDANSNTDRFKYSILNIDTLEKIENPVQALDTEQLFESPNGKYFILNNELSDMTYYVYNSNFEKKYESNNELKPIDDKYVLEIVERIPKYIVNIETMEKNEISVEGKYLSNNNMGLVTREKKADENEEKEYYNLYLFN